MEEFGSKEKSEVYSKAVRAGKRTYFFDVKATRSDEMYLTITESKRKYDPQTDAFFYEKHKLFLYKEDFDKFSTGLEEMIHFIRTGDLPKEEETNLNPNEEIGFDNQSEDNINSI
ncbi:MAG: DUF3276 family protein [Bacteroidales bacterium]|nr:DUF3276 family protein [Bacteroidales bacterium]MDD4576268.1 DUF3276 family protein [Bacteroidales bacterium]